MLEFFQLLSHVPLPHDFTNEFKGTNMLFNKLTHVHKRCLHNVTYKLTCRICDKAYIGQTGSSPRAMFSKHNRYEYSHPRYTDFDKIMLKRNMTQYVGKFLHIHLQARMTTDQRTTYP